MSNFSFRPHPLPTTKIIFSGIILKNIQFIPLSLTEFDECFVNFRENPVINDLKGIYLQLHKSVSVSPVCILECLYLYHLDVF